MKHLSIHSLLAALLLAAAPSLAKAEKVDAVFTHDSGSGSHIPLGTQQKDTIDLAIRLTGPDLKGKTIKAVEVPMNGTPHITDIKVWLSRELSLTDGKNAPDILTFDVPSLTSSSISVTFAEPYTIMDDTLFVGYSFVVETLDNTNKEPALVATDTNTGGFFMHSAKFFPTWNDYSSNGSLTTRVTLGGVEAYGAAFGPLGVIRGQYDQPTDVALTLTNAGAAAISSIDYAYTQGLLTGTVHLDLDTPLRANYGASVKTTVTLPAAVKADEPLSFSHSFDLDKAVSTQGERLAQNLNALRVVALLIDGTGKVANAAKSKVWPSAAAGIRTAKTETAQSTNAYYDLSGRCLAAPSKGLNIIRTASGKTIKVMR